MKNLSEPCMHGLMEEARTDPSFQGSCPLPASPGKLPTGGLTEPRCQSSPPGQPTLLLGYIPGPACCRWLEYIAPEQAPTGFTAHVGASGPPLFSGSKWTEGHDNTCSCMGHKSTPNRLKAESKENSWTQHSGELMGDPHVDQHPRDPPRQGQRCPRTLSPKDSQFSCQPPPRGS